MNNRVYVIVKINISLPKLRLELSLKQTLTLANNNCVTFEHVELSSTGIHDLYIFMVRCSGR